MLFPDVDPDFPVTDDTGIPQTVHDRLELLLTKAADSVTYPTHEPDEHLPMIRMIRRDEPLLRIAALPWIHARLQGLDGTIVLIF